ncbi:LysR family transcriptional regulator [Actinoplanes sp. N902-109]|uniref:LysR family transcriptional regulator n=1 Tax=Actinoplanes sp. (strain N902-109) TaxID=649831 RepID=UPI00032941AE|nr:LysR family transcriptional regulator [Actinoplanes sp. N902-109]AGL12193.1 LysR-family transcriptional regulator [Actinoplanes sp. N902-109]AGL16455.1 LysR family transcriptional regulator [Actinoplanes sp. N902-109]
MLHSDLNLLRALDVLIEERSVGAAARRLRLSQPAMSRTLGRIRRATGDEILVRSGRSMTLTPYARAVRDELHALVARAESVLQPPSMADLPSVERTYTLQCNDALASVLASRLAQVVACEAPKLRLRFLAEPATTSDDLRRGQVDLRVSSDPAESPDLRSTTITHDHLVAAVRTGHPDVDTLGSPDGFAAQRHVLVSRRGRVRDQVDDALEARGLRRTVSLTVPTAALAIRAVAGSDLVVALPGRLLADEVTSHGLTTRPLPVEVPALPAFLVWHQRNTRDPVHGWLRDQVRTLIEEQAAAT